ncbi:hypothetical protein BDW22DRAFT_670595 [Trametopsis cervina]|nr:hypothetical protein BDW22DRAFT_670595 [Trametopsis cervina]
MPVALNDLPIELVGAVVAQVASIGDLLSLRAVNHTFSAYATPRAFATYHVVNTNKSVIGHASLLEHVGLARLVRTLVVHCEASPGENRLVNRVEENAESHEIRLAMGVNLARLALLPHLQELELDFFSGMVWQNFKSAGGGGMTMTVASPSKYFMLQTAIIQAITDGGPDSLPPSLTSFTIANLIPFPAPEYQNPSFELLMSRLSRFSLSAHALRFSGRHGEDMFSWFWSEMIPERFLEPAQPKLTTLSLFSDQPVGQFPAVDLSWLRFPHLTTLSLNGFMFNEQRLVEDFIVRHGRTLEHITLDTCPIHIGGVEGMPPRTWASILQRFTDKLPALLDLQMVRRTGWGLHEVDPRIAQLCSYERCLTGYGYERGRDNKLPLSVLQADRVALRNLLRAVNIRRQQKWLAPLDLPDLAVPSAAS